MIACIVFKKNFSKNWQSANKAHAECSINLGALCLGLDKISLLNDVLTKLWAKLKR